MVSTTSLDYAKPVTERIRRAAVAPPRSNACVINVVRFLKELNLSTSEPDTAASLTPDTPRHTWHFFRSGGFDQVSLQHADDLRHLAELDPKLWTVLNCPTTGVALDSKTLALIDADADGQLRVPEILAAVNWCCERLSDVDILFAPAGLPVSAIADHDILGAGIKQAALQVLRYLDKPLDSAIHVADLSDTTRLFSADHFNGDGIVTPELTNDSALKQLIVEVIATQGAVADRSGHAGVNEATLTQFWQQIDLVLNWHAHFVASELQLCPLAEQTAAAVAIFEQVQPKIDDYFLRCQLVAFDETATASLNPAANIYTALSGRVLTTHEADIAALPLARIAANQALPLGVGLNPAWVDTLNAFNSTVVQPLLGEHINELSLAQWQQITIKLAAWRSWMAARPDSKVHELGLARLEQLRDSSLRQQVLALIAADVAASTFANNLMALEQLVRYQRDLVTLLRNFVTLSDFYQGERKAIFQAGTLYLDQRSCNLVMVVSDMNKHAAMAPFSGCYLVYCQCVRQGESAITIAAALTGGDVDELMVVGRNGVYYDRQGRDWKASVIKVVVQPVSVRQAFWTPYRRMAAFIETQVQKFAASRDKEIETQTTTQVAESSTAAPNGFDIAKFAGIFAAFGLAIGALGGAFAALMAALFTLLWWQIPLVITAAIILISTPSMLMAFLTLRRRNLGPLLDANGWAVNTRARINLPFGAALTDVAHLPAGAIRTLRDPFADKKNRWPRLFGALMLFVGVLWLMWTFMP